MYDEDKDITGFTMNDYAEKFAHERFGQHYREILERGKNGNIVAVSLDWDAVLRAEIRKLHITPQTLSKLTKLDAAVAEQWLAGEIQLDGETVKDGLATRVRISQLALHSFTENARYNLRQSVVTLRDFYGVSVETLAAISGVNEQAIEAFLSDWEAATAQDADALSAAVISLMLAVI